MMKIISLHSHIIKKYSPRLFFLLPLLAPAFVFAQDIGPVRSLLNNIFRFLGAIVEIGMLFAFVIFGWGILKLITANGDPKKVGDAKGILTWGIIGIFILASMGGIIYFINAYIGIPTKPVIQAPLWTQ